MSTIPSASPRPSIGSRRTSNSTSTATAEVPTERSTARRNKAAALRDYYGLQSGQPTATPPKVSLDAERESEVDRPSFSAQVYVERILKEQDLATVLRTEVALTKEVWGLDGERKALVYDNYSKLIGATETIKNMRERMETRRMETSTLAPAIGHIAESASALAAELFQPDALKAGGGGDAAATRRVEQQATVRWVLDAPARLRTLVEEGRHAEAKQEWDQVSALLSRWAGVRGVDEVEKGCLQALASEKSEAP